MAQRRLESSTTLNKFQPFSENRGVVRAPVGFIAEITPTVQAVNEFEFTQPGSEVVVISTTLGAAEDPEPLIVPVCIPDPLGGEP